MICQVHYIVSTFIILVCITFATIFTFFFPITKMIVKIKSGNNQGQIRMIMKKNKYPPPLSRSEAPVVYHG